MVYESPTSDDARIDVAALFGAIVPRLLRIVLVTLALLAATFVFLMFQPRLYESSASVLVEPRNNVFLNGQGQGGATILGNPVGVVSSQIELIKSRDTMLRVLEQTGLRDVPEFAAPSSGFSPVAIIGRLLGQSEPQEATDSAILANLLAATTVAQQRDSAVISISVRSQDPDLAARIANSIASIHVSRRAELSLSDTADASGWLLDEIERLRVSVPAAENAVAEFRVDNDLYQGAGSASLLDQQISTLSGQISAAQERRTTAASRASLIRGLVEQGRTLEGVPDIQSSAVIQQLTQQRVALQGERAQLSATLLPNHPNVRAVAAQISELDQQIAIEGRQVADGLEAEAEIEASLEASLRTDLENLMQNASTATREDVTLQGLMRESEAQRELLESYLRRYNEAVSRTDTGSALPDVRVISIAAPTINPVSPQTSLVMIAVAIASILIQVGIILFSELMSGRALRQPVYAPMPATPEAAPATDTFEQPPFAAPLPAAPVQTFSAVDATADFGPVVPQVDYDRTEPGFDDTFASSDDDVMVPQPLGEISDPVDLEAPLVTEVPGSIEAPAPVLAATAFSDRKTLASDMVLGRCRILLLAGIDSAEAADRIADRLAGEVLNKGVSVAIIDAGSGRTTPEMGISDLAAGKASFGDVVHKSGDDGFALVPWGQTELFNARSPKPITLAEALGDIYEVVIIATGKLGQGSNLDAFAGIQDRLVLVSDGNADAETIEDLRQDLATAGFGRADIIIARDSVAA